MTPGLSLRLRCAVWLLLAVLAAEPLQAQPSKSFMPPPSQWTQLPAIPDKEGFAAPFAGVSGGALIVAGGANVVGERWANPLQKKWYDSVFVLQHPGGPWLAGFKLRRPLAYGVSITTPDGLICIGGSDSTRHYADVFRLNWTDGKLHVTELPSLPGSCANACGALLGHTIFVAGGLESPDSAAALRTFWALDLREPSRGWSSLEPWPGPERMLAVAGVLEDSFFLFSGASVSRDSAGNSVRTFLRDAYCFTPGRGWRRVADLPRAAVAAPSPAIEIGPHHLLILSGDDGSLVDFSPLENHPGFPKECLAFDSISGAWQASGTLPFSRVTVPTVSWLDFKVIPNGEVRPRVRTPEVWAFKMEVHP